VVFGCSGEFREGYWEYLGVAAGASEHAVGEAAHLRVSTFAGVAADNVREHDYLPQRLEGCPVEEAAA